MPWPLGAWRRVSVTVDGSTSQEVSEVWWLICGELFADLRVLRAGATTDLPFSQTQAFAGSFSYDEQTGNARWVHLTDTLTRAGQFTGALAPDPTDRRLMHERGEGFSEVWARMDVDGSTASALDVDGLRGVRVGEHVVAVRGDGTGAVHLQRCQGTWVVVDAIGARPPSLGELEDLV